ncbi:MAG: hypothetical protein HC892_08625 [Saprospiraceae bacterium]|nr:hypothetical protein [Saprospiraceae bacterium]
MLSHFQTRLWWRSHYIQKLESEWQIEFEPINKGFLLLDRHLTNDLRLGLTQEQVFQWWMPVCAV